MTTTIQDSFDLELCPFMSDCNPEDARVENYCFMNKEECEQYKTYLEALRFKRMVREKEMRSWADFHSP
jgi:hypothetical protein